MNELCGGRPNSHSRTQTTQLDQFTSSRRERRIVAQDEILGMHSFFEFMKSTRRSRAQKHDNFCLFTRNESLVQIMFEKLTLWRDL